jgi:hypothetical protein
MPSEGRLLVRAAIGQEQDEAYEGAETFELQVMASGRAAVSGTATIADDGTGVIYDESGNEDSSAEKDDDRPITVSSPIVNEGSPSAVFSVGNISGRLLSLSLVDGTAIGHGSIGLNGRLDYNAGSLQYSLDDGESWISYNGPFRASLSDTATDLLVRTALVKDGHLDNNETFDLVVTGGDDASSTGTAIIKDDGTGVIFADNGSENTTAIKDDDVLNLSAALEGRAAWMINTYRNFTIGAPKYPNGIEAQKFGWADVLTRLHLNPNDRAPINRFVNLFRTGSTNYAFMPAGAGWILSKYWDRFTLQERNSIILPVLKKGDVLGHGTENIFLIKYVGAYLFSQLWPNETGWFDSIRRRRINSAELGQLAKAGLLTTLKSYYSKGYHENLSPNYLPLHFHALQALYNNTTDPELKAAADAALTFHVADMAANYFNGSTIAPYNRPASSPIVDAQKNISINNQIKALYWLYWAETMNTSSQTTAAFVGSGPNAGARDEAKHFTVTSALSTWRPPALFSALARGSGIEPYTLQSSVPAFGEFAKGAPGDTLRTVYREERFAVGSGVFTQQINNGLSERMGMEIIYKSTDNQNTIVFHHPYWRTNSNQYKWLARSSPFQQNVQHESTLISLFNIPKVDPFAGRTRSDFEALRNQYRSNLIQQAWIRYPKAADEVVQTNGWIFLREQETYIAIRPWNPYTVHTGDFSDMNVVRSSGATNAIISDIATVDQFSSFAQFRSAVLSSPLTVNLNTPAPYVSYTNVKGDTITARWGQSDYRASRINSWPIATVNGEVRVPDQDFLQGRAVIKSAPVTLANRVLKVDLPAGQLEVDWRNNTPIFNASDYRASFARVINAKGHSLSSHTPGESLPLDEMTSSVALSNHSHLHDSSVRDRGQASSSSMASSRSSRAIDPRGLISRGWARSLWTFSGQDGIVEYHINDKGRGRGNLPMSAKESNFIRSTFGLLDRLTGLSYKESETASAADIRIKCAANLGGSEGATFRANGWFDVFWKDKKDFKLTAFEKHLIRHEIAHALGLDHPYGNGANPRYDTRDTVMSYNWTGNYNYTFSDVQALQELWGVG